jgi:hypothetical protein
MDLEEIRKLCALMREEDLVELTVEEGGRRITLRRAEENRPSSKWGTSCSPDRSSVSWKP